MRLAEENDDTKHTVDGMPVEVGDRVWFWRGYGNVRERVLNKTDLGPWWSMTRTLIYSTERAALEAAIAGERRALRKAAAEMRRAMRATARHASRLKDLRPR